MNHKITSFIAVLLFLFVIGTFGMLTICASASPPDKKQDKFVISIKIEKGDTLWSIANRYYTNDFHDLEAYIKEIKKSNHLINDTIYTGRYLIIPHYPPSSSLERS